MIAGHRNIWILGGTGFIGQALVNHLSKQPFNRLHLLLHKKIPHRHFEGFNTFTGSLDTIDPDWFERYPPDVVFHAARLAGGNGLTRWLAARKGEKANRRLAGILSALAKPPVVVYVSGSLVFGNQPKGILAEEHSPVQPEAFARYYYRNELPWLEAREKGLLDVRFARPGWIVGPASWFSEFFWKPFLTSGKVPCYGDGSNYMSLIHIDDCAAMIDALSLFGQPRNDLNVFSAKPILHLDFCRLMARWLNTSIDQVPEKEVTKVYGKTTAAALMSNTPMTTLFPGLHDKARLQYPGPDALLASVLGLLKNEQGIFAKTPEKGSV